MNDAQAGDQGRGTQGCMVVGAAAGVMMDCGTSMNEEEIGSWKKGAVVAVGAATTDVDVDATSDARKEGNKDNGERFTTGDGLNVAAAAAAAVAA